MFCQASFLPMGTRTDPVHINTMIFGHCGKNQQGHINTPRPKLKYDILYFTK